MPYMTLNRRIPSVASFCELYIEASSRFQVNNGRHDVGQSKEHLKFHWAGCGGDDFILRKTYAISTTEDRSETWDKQN